MFRLKINLKAFLIISFACLSLGSLNSHTSQGLVNSRRKPMLSPDSEPFGENYKRIKRQVDKNVDQFQQFLTSKKEQCIRDMDFPVEAMGKLLMHEHRPTNKEKCLMECLLKRVDIMTMDNKIQPDSIANIAGIVSAGNPLVIAIAKATAENCNRFVTAKEKCEAAYQINKCISNELKTHKVRIFY